jgi:hypothetical protein
VYRIAIALIRIDENRNLWPEFDLPTPTPGGEPGKDQTAGVLYPKMDKTTTLGPVRKKHESGSTEFGKRDFLKVGTVRYSVL